MTTNIPAFQIYWADGKFSALPDSSSVIALGTFDGVHVAHSKLICEAISLKEQLGAKYVGAWSFIQAPASLLTNHDIPMLTTVEDKIRLLLSKGLDFVAIGDFRDFRDISAERFIVSFLKNKLCCIGTVCGFNHRFGHMGKGSPDLLEKEFGKASVITVPEITVMGETVSSSCIRKKLSEGEIASANEMLGRPYSICAEVVSNKKLGHKLGFPTANQYFPDGIAVPKHGIYASLCTTPDGKRYIGVSNVGVRPTISDSSDDHVLNCETYIHDFSGNIYGQMLTVEFCCFIRDEKKFSSIEELTAAISNDTACAIEHFNNTPL